MKYKENRIYKVYWNDITANTQTIIKKENLAKCWTIGYLEENKDEMVVKYGGNEDNEWCFDAIPKSVITKIEEVC